MQKSFPRAPKIPMALGNDLYWSYTADIVSRLKVRWIEMAAVLPMWTTMIMYYVEGNYGHTMNEVVGKQQDRTATRGQCFSFAMPWKEMIEEFRHRDANEQEEFMELPRNGRPLVCT